MKWKLMFIFIFIAFMGIYMFNDYTEKKELEEKNNVELTKDDEQLSDSQSNTKQIGIEVGQQVPNIKLNTLEGKSFNLNDYRGKRVILNFWASWCPPCKAEMPDMQKFYEKYHVQGIEVIAVNLTTAEKKLEDVKTFRDNYGITFTIPLDEKGVTAYTFKTQTIPTSYLIDSQGIIKNKVVGPMSYDWMVNQLENMK